MLKCSIEETSRSVWNLEKNDEGYYLSKKKISDTIETLRESRENSFFSRIISKKVITSTSELVLKLPLKQVSKEEIRNLRKSKEPGFVFKENDKFFYTKVPKRINLVENDLLGEHLCGSSMPCMRLSAASDQLGGCAKVRDIRKDITRYPFIKIGYEVFNASSPTSNVFTVLQCAHHKKSIIAI